MERKLATLGLFCGVIALVVSVTAGKAGHGNLFDRHENTANATDAMSPDAISAEKQFAIRLDDNAEAVLPAWTSVLAALKVDLAMTDLQAESAGKALQTCDKSLRTAIQQEDPLWRDRLIKRAPPPVPPPR